MGVSQKRSGLTVARKVLLTENRCRFFFPNKQPAPRSKPFLPHPRSRHFDQTIPHKHLDAKLAPSIRPPFVASPSRLSSLVCMYTMPPSEFASSYLLPEVLVDVVAQQRGVTTHVTVAVLQAKLRGYREGAGWAGGQET